MEACHEAINDGEGLVHQWRVTQLKRPGIPGPLAEADNVDSQRSPGWSSALTSHIGLAHSPLTG